VEVVASLSQGRTAAAQCGLFTYKSVPVIFEPPCNKNAFTRYGADLSDLEHVADQIRNPAAHFGTQHKM